MCAVSPDRLKIYAKIEWRTRIFNHEGHEGSRRNSVVAIDPMSEIDQNSLPILKLLRADGQLRSPQAHAIPLTGGVSSDVFLVEDGERRFVVKQALPKLKVKDLWQADVSRNRTEYEYLEYAGRILPESVPRVFAAGQGYFTMEYLGEGYVNWKQMLLAGQCHVADAAQAGRALGTIHRVSAGNAEAARIFDTTRNFHQLRTDPYLVTTGQRHPELREYFERETVRLESTQECLVHGDFSPKNILIGNGRQVILDCEVAWYGDPAFDLGFLLNHFLLKKPAPCPAQGWNESTGRARDSRVFCRRRRLAAAMQEELTGVPRTCCCFFCWPALTASRRRNICAARRRKTLRGNS